MHLTEFNRVLRPYSISSALLAVALVCGACGTTAAVDTAAEPAAGTPQTGSTVPQTTEPLIELGEFNANNDEFVLFNPCTSIPWEVYEQVGFSETLWEPHNDPSGSISCSFKSGTAEHHSGFFMVTADKVPYQRILDRGLLLNEAPPSGLPGVYTHHLGEETINSCTAAVHTVAGRLTVLFNDRDRTDQRDALCEIAIEYLENIYQHSGGR